MICIQCENEQFTEKPDAVIEQEFKGEVVKVKMVASACTKCGWTTVTLAQADELRRRTADAYRQKHGLLTSEQIKALRKLLNKSQREFAAFLGVGEASVKRWETWLVQEKGSDQLMRMKCEKAIHEQLLKSAPTKFSVSVSYTCTMVHSSQGFVVQPALITARPSKWAKEQHTGCSIAAEETFDEARYCGAANEELALAA